MNHNKSYWIEVAFYNVFKSIKLKNTSLYEKVSKILDLFNEWQDEENLKKKEKDFERLKELMDKSLKSLTKDFDLNDANFIAFEYNNEKFSDYLKENLSDKEKIILKGYLGDINRMFGAKAYEQNIMYTINNLFNAFLRNLKLEDEALQKQKEEEIKNINQNKEIDKQNRILKRIEEERKKLDSNSNLDIEEAPLEKKNYEENLIRKIISAKESSSEFDNNKLQVVRNKLKEEIEWIKNNIDLNNTTNMKDYLFCLNNALTNENMTSMEVDAYSYLINYFNKLINFTSDFTKESLLSDVNLMFLSVNNLIEDLYKYNIIKASMFDKKLVTDAVCDYEVMHEFSPKKLIKKYGERLDKFKIIYYNLTNDEKEKVKEIVNQNGKHFISSDEIVIKANEKIKGYLKHFYFKYIDREYTSKRDIINMFRIHFEYLNEEEIMELFHYFEDKHNSELTNPKLKIDKNLHNEDLDNFKFNIATILFEKRDNEENDEIVKKAAINKIVKDELTSMAIKTIKQDEE